MQCECHLLCGSATAVLQERRLAFIMKVAWLFLFVWLLICHKAFTFADNSADVGEQPEEEDRVLSEQQTVVQKQRLRGPKALCAPR